MLKSYFSNDKTESDNVCRIRLIKDALQEIAEAQELLVLIYGQYCEAARLLRENKIETCVDMPEEHAESVLSTICGFYQICSLLDSRREELEYQIERKAQAQEEK